MTDEATGRDAAEGYKEQPRSSTEFWREFEAESFEESPES
jgi:hypothetical protein